MSEKTTKNIYLSHVTFERAEELGYRVKNEDFNNNYTLDQVVFSEMRASNGVLVCITRSPLTMGFEEGLWEVSLHRKNRDLIMRDEMVSFPLSEEAIRNWLLPDTARGSYEFQTKRKHWFIPEDDLNQLLEQAEDRSMNE